MEKSNLLKEETSRSVQSENKPLLKRTSLKKKQAMGQILLDDFTERLKVHTADIFDEQYKNLVKQMYYLEEKWSHLIGDEYMNSRMKKQQECLWEFLSTERNYICRMRVVLEVFQQVFRIAQREGDLLDFDSKEIFANIDQVLLTNDTIWRDYLVKVLNKTRKKKRPIKPSELLAAFTKTEELYESYMEFCMLQDGCLKRIRELSNGSRENSKKARFKVYLDFCEELVQSERYKLVDLMTEPMQRVTRYPLLLKSILESTENPQEKKQLQNMIKVFEDFLVKINTSLRMVHEKNKLEKALEEFEEYNTWSAGNEDVIWSCLDFLRSEISKVKEPRCLLERGNVKLIDKKGKSEMNVEMLLFTDVIVFSRRRTSTKKLVVTKQLHFLDRVKFIRSEISSTSIVVLYLDEHGMLANAMMLEMGEKDRDRWIDEVSKAQDRYEKAKAGSGSTLEFFQDNKGASDENINTTVLPRKTSDLVKSVEVIRRPSVESRKAVGGGDAPLGRNTSSKNFQKLEDSKEDLSPLSRNSSFQSLQTIEDNRETGIDRRSASWLLTDEKKVHSIRTLLREDLWGHYVKVKPSFSFRSEASDSGISMGESFNSRKSNDSPVNGLRIHTSDSDDSSKETTTLVRNRSNASISSQNSDTSTLVRNRSNVSISSQSSDTSTLVRNRSNASISSQSSDAVALGRNRSNASTASQNSVAAALVRNRSNASTASQETSERTYRIRKISVTNSSLPGISEHVYTEMTFLPNSQVKDKRQRRSLKTSLPKDQNNNREKPITPPNAPPITPPITPPNTSPITTHTVQMQPDESDEHIYDDVTITSDHSIVSSDDVTILLSDDNFDTPESYLENR